MRGGPQRGPRPNRGHGGPGHAGERSGNAPGSGYGDGSRGAQHTRGRRPGSTPGGRTQGGHRPNDRPGHASRFGGGGPPRSINGAGRSATRGRQRNSLENLLREFQRATSIDPFERIVLETEPHVYTTRALDLLTPIGKGQRCLIVAPPKAGKTTLLKDAALGVMKNHPDIEVVILLVDERPEEVTDFRRAVPTTLYAASSDQTAAEHIRIADEALQRALESVLAGRDVVLLLDSITRLARAHNVMTGNSGRTMTGGLDAQTMQIPRQIFGAARKIEGGGSLTILGTALVDTGSRMDEVIFQEFKGTGNMELVLSRQLFEKRIFPCIDVAKSGTRKEEKLYDPQVVVRAQRLRRALSTLDPAAAMEYVLELLRRHPDNAALLGSLPVG